MESLFGSYFNSDEFINNIKKALPWTETGLRGDETQAPVDIKTFLRGLSPYTTPTGLDTASEWPFKGPEQIAADKAAADKAEADKAAADKAAEEAARKAAAEAFQARLNGILTKNQNFQTGQSNFLNSAYEGAKARMAPRQIAQPYNTAAPYNFAPAQLRTFAEGGLSSLPQSPYYMSPDLLKPVTQDTVDTGTQPMYRDRVQAITLANPWTKEEPKTTPKTDSFLSPEIQGTVLELSQGRGGSGDRAEAGGGGDRGLPVGLAGPVNSLGQFVGNVGDTLGLGKFGLNSLSHAITNAAISGAMTGSGAKAGSSTGPAAGAVNSSAGGQYGGWGGRDAGGGTTSGGTSSGGGYSGGAGGGATGAPAGGRGGYGTGIGPGPGPGEARGGFNMNGKYYPPKKKKKR